MTDEEGREVDVDLVRDSASRDWVEGFDVWRIRRFLDQGPHRGLSDDELSAACSYLSRHDELREVQPGRWFVLGPGLR
jgi:hypothetical protein